MRLRFIGGRWYTLWLLSIVYAFNVGDRFLLSLLLPKIKQEMELPDWSLGLLTGLAFALFYSTIGIQMGRLADQYRRATIVAASLALFSLATTLSGLALGLFTLAATRMLVGIGEAGTGPASYSMIADLFEKSRRATAMSIYACGGNIGLLCTFVFGGMLVVSYGWRETFVMIGLAGLTFSVVAYLTIGEPERGLSDGMEKRGSATLRESVAFLSGLPSVFWLLLGISIVQIVVATLTSWVPSVMVRTHGLDEASLGIRLGMIMGLVGIIGTFLLGGLLTDYLSRRDVRWLAWNLALGELIMIAGIMLFILAPNGSLALFAYVLPALTLTLHIPPALAISQVLAPVPMRATAGALMMLIANLVGYGIGPLLIGWLSDHLAIRFGDDSLRQALWVTPAILPIAIFAFVRCARELRKDIAKAELWGATS